MIYTYEYKVGAIEEGDKEYFERVNPGYKVTGETLEEHYEGFDENGRLVDGGGCTYAVMKGRFTKYGMCRDCGDHYIIARWSRYDRVDKNSLTVKFDVKDR